jgi:predicted nuclease of predicted toxin-antitoxin system
MILWIDAQLSPAVASWLNLTFAVTAVPLRDLGLRDATDREIFLAARREGATVVSKDADFVRLLEDLGPPPQIIWDYVRQYFKRSSQANPVKPLGQRS